MDSILEGFCFLVKRDLLFQSRRTIQYMYNHEEGSEDSRVLHKRFASVVLLHKPLKYMGYSRSFDWNKKELQHRGNTQQLDVLQGSYLSADHYMKRNV
eukprot:scaffold2574_cov98-Cylindrotheca_fusiformis.AAC.12